MQREVISTGKLRMYQCGHNLHSGCVLVKATVQQNGAISYSHFSLSLFFSSSLYIYIKTRFLRTLREPKLPWPPPILCSGLTLNYSQVTNEGISTQYDQSKAAPMPIEGTRKANSILGKCTVLILMENLLLWTQVPLQLHLNII